jgi:hypothetical protein
MATDNLPNDYFNFTCELMEKCDEIEAHLYAISMMQERWAGLGAADTITVELMEQFLRAGYFLRTATGKLSGIRDELDLSYGRFYGPKSEQAA